MRLPSSGLARGSPTSPLTSKTFWCTYCSSELGRWAFLVSTSHTTVLSEIEVIRGAYADVGGGTRIYEADGDSVYFCVNTTNYVHFHVAHYHAIAI